MTASGDKPTVVQKWDILDRGDGVEVRTQYRDDRIEPAVWDDEKAEELAREILRIVEADDRPVRDGSQHIRQRRTNK